MSFTIEIIIFTILTGIKGSFLCKSARSPLAEQNRPSGILILTAKWALRSDVANEGRFGPGALFRRARTTSRSKSRAIR